MSKIYDYEEYQNQRVKVTYTDKRKYREENIVGLYGQVIKTTSGSIAVQIDGMYNAASSMDYIGLKEVNWILLEMKVRRIK